MNKELGNTIIQEYAVSYALQGSKKQLLPSPEKSNKPGLCLVDLDDTVKEAEQHLWPDGKTRRVLPQTIAAFKALYREGISIGIVTEQSFTEIQPWIQDVANLVLDNANSDPFIVFNGLIIGEGGSVIKKPGNEAPIVVAPKGAIEDREKLLGWFCDAKTIIPSEEKNWGILQGIDPEEGTYVELATGDNQGMATISLWEKGPHISQDPSIEKKYNMVKARVDTAIEDLGITTLKTYEAGNGTLRVVPTSINKGHTMALLKAVGMFDPQQAVYFCDGPNDIALAEYLKKKGGKVITVGNAVDQLKSLSDYTATGHVGLGFAEAVEKMFPQLYAEALTTIIKDAYTRKFIDDLIQVSPDLRSNNLAFTQAKALFDKFSESNAQTESEFLATGKDIWKHIGKEILGPLMVCFVDIALHNIPANGVAIFPARDATPFYHIAKTLQVIDPHSYPVEILNPVFNRKLWGVEDEQDAENGVSSVKEPIVQKFLGQMGIGSGKALSFIEVGAYGTMVRALKEAGYHDFGVQFFFSQVPFIPGFINHAAEGLHLPPGQEEIIADSLEGLPKSYKRPTKLIQNINGVVTVSLEGKKVDSPFLEQWQQAFFSGLEEATTDYILYKQTLVEW